MTDTNSPKEGDPMSWSDRRQEPGTYALDADLTPEQRAAERHMACLDALAEARRRLAHAITDRDGKRHTARLAENDVEAAERRLKEVESELLAARADR